MKMTMKFAPKDHCNIFLPTQFYQQVKGKLERHFVISDMMNDDVFISFMGKYGDVYFDFQYLDCHSSSIVMHAYYMCQSVMILNV